MSRTRIFYGTQPEAVVIEKDGKPIATYRSAEELVETHIKGLLAKDQLDTKRIRDLIQKYRPTDSVAKS